MDTSPKRLEKKGPPGKLGGLLVILLALAGFALGDLYYLNSRIAPNTRVGALSVGELTPGEALTLLTSTSISQILPKSVTFIAEDIKLVHTLEDLGAHIDYPATVEEAMRKSWQGSLPAIWYRRLTGQPLVIEPSLQLDAVSTFNALKKDSAYIDRPVRDPELYPLPDKKAAVRPGLRGRTLKIKESGDIALEMAKEGQLTIPLKIVYEDPKVTEVQLTALLPLHVLSSFTTVFGTHDSPNRIHNIHHIAQLINNSVILPEGVFSLLGKTGDFTAKGGYKEAYVILEGKLEPQYGGGTCQIATTLFNTAALADMEILSRKNHSLYFSIYPMGRDATVYYPYLDFKFKNNTGHDVVLTARATKKSLTFRLFGHPTGKVVTFTRPQIWHSGKPFKTKVIQTTMLNGKVLRQKIWYSSYKLNGDTDEVPIIRHESR